MDYLNNKWIDIKSKWNGFNRNVKIATIVAAIIIIVWIIKWVMKKNNVLFVDVIKTNALVMTSVNHVVAK